GPEQGGAVAARQSVLDVTARQPQEYHPRQLVVLSGLHLDPAGLGGRQRLTGSVAYRELGPVSGTLALRLTCVRGKNTRSLYTYFDGKKLNKDGVLKFAFPPVLRGDEEAPAGP